MNSIKCKECDYLERMIRPGSPIHKCIQHYYKCGYSPYDSVNYICRRTFSTKRGLTLHQKSHNE